MSTSPATLLQCGIGYGKTFVGALDMRMAVDKYHDRNFMIVSRDLPQFKKAILPEWLNMLKLFGDEEGVDYEYNRSSHTFYFIQQKVTIYCTGATNYDSAFRGPNIAYIWADEADFYKREAWETMLGRLRVYPEILKVTSSPKGFNHIYDYFEGNDDATVLQAPTWENMSLSDNYIKTLKKTYSPLLFNQEVAGERLNTRSGSIFDEFDRKRHVKKCRNELLDTDQLYFFTDYNVSNYCGTYMFFRDGVVHAIGEEHLKFKNSRIMAQTVKSKYPDRPVIVVGDSTGNNKRDVAIDKTNYQHFRDAGLLTKNFLNPPVESRIISSNSNFYHDKIVVDPSCKNLIRDLELLIWKEDGSGIDKSDISLSHAADGYTYGLWFFIPVILKSTQKVSSYER